MNRRQQVIIGVVILGLLAVALTYPLWSPVFINNVVDEAFPDLSAAQRDRIREMPQEQQDVLVQMAETDTDMAQETALAMLDGDTEMAEDMPQDTPTALFTGTFDGFDAIHRGAGSATLYEMTDGTRILRLEDFSTSNGPDLHVLLTSNIPDSIGARLNDNYIDVGRLKGNIGNQNYEIPDEVNLNDYVAVVIYCVPFRVNFTVAAFE